MITGIRERTIVQAGGRVEIPVTDLPIGTEVEVIILGFASKVLNFGVLPQKSGIFEKSCIDNKGLNNVLPQKCLIFSTFEAKPLF